MSVSNSSAPSAKFIDTCFDGKQPDAAMPSLWVLRERDNARKLVVPALREAVKDHIIGLELIEKLGGFPNSVKMMKALLPTRKTMRSGDLGEILATEYVDQKTSYRVPIKRLRYKDDREMAMRGDDVIAVKQSETRKAATSVLKVEAKSRATLAASTVKEASEALMNYSARPNPRTLAFIWHKLAITEGRLDDAKLIEELQQKDVRDEDIEHLLFTFSGNDPKTALAKYASASGPNIKRLLVGLVVDDHQDLIEQVFQSVKL